MKTNNWAKGLFKLVVVVPLALLSSCAHTPRYVEPKLPQDQLAVLDIAAPVWIISLDGQTVTTSSFSDHTRVRVCPGRHSVELSYRHMETHNTPPPVFNGAVYNAREVSSYGHENANVTKTSLNDINLNFVAKPGFTYGVDAGAVGNSWNPTIREVMPAN